MEDEPRADVSLWLRSIQLSLFACLFITLLVVNLVLAKFVLKEKITPPKIIGAALIILGAVMAAAGTPTSGGQLQEKYTCQHGDECVCEPRACIHTRVRQRPRAPAPSA